ncbi:MAG: hypothetical protein MUE60_09690 [Candidatus Eisenbacteria bacterium]|jgi:hypothetical protein|nr:hypothetical protein [Candidatus Eisenbacteria bacterium]
MWWCAIPLCIVVASQTPGFEPETLYRGDIDHGGFGGPVVKLTEIADEFGVIAGVRGGWIIDHRLTLGAGVYGMASQNMELDPMEIGGVPGQEYRLEVGYAGLELEFAAQPHRLMHVTLQTLVGGGGVAYLEGERAGHWDDEDAQTLSSDGFFIAEPGINLELNVAKPFRVALGASYRFVTDVDLQGLANEDLSGLGATITLKFGSF